MSPVLSPPPSPPASKNGHQKGQDVPKPFLDHLEELRTRFIRILVVVSVFFAGSYFLVDPIIKLLANYTGGFVFLGPTEAFFARLKIAITVGLILAIPIIIFEVWRFVGVALTPKERNSTLKMLPFSYFLFLSGAACAWFLVMPMALKFLLGFSTESLQAFISIDKFVGFAAWFTVAFGAMFQLPIVVFFLVKIGVATPESLSYYRPHVVLGLAIMAAFLTPGPDFFSQMALLIPTYILFELSILMAKGISPKNTDQGEK